MHVTSARVLKVRENGMRIRAERQGLQLRKSRRMDPLAIGYGTYGLYDNFDRPGELIHGDRRTGFGLSLDQVEEILNRGRNMKD